MNYVRSSLMMLALFLVGSTSQAAGLVCKSVLQLEPTFGTLRTHQASAGSSGNYSTGKIAITDEYDPSDLAETLAAGYRAPDTSASFEANTLGNQIQITATIAGQTFHASGAGSVKFDFANGWRINCSLQ